MPTSYTCERCEKAFTQKSHFEKHKARKRPCKKDVAVEALVEKKVQAALLGVVAAQPAPKPFLKWVGGKTQILDEVLATFPPSMQNYYEPFLGGGSVLLGLLSQVKAGKISVAGKIYASDINSNLIGLYKNIQSQPDALIAAVKLLVTEFSTAKTGSDATVNREAATLEEALTSQESYYFWIRSRFNALSKEERQTPTASAMLLFMNKTGFRGVYREGPRGINVPFGNYKNPSIMDEAHIRDVSVLIKDVVFRVAPFTDALASVAAGDFVYLDPPYAPETDTSFVGYTADGFSQADHEALFTRCANLVAGGAGFLLSNAAVKMVKDAFPEPAYKTVVISCRRAINSKKPDAVTNEVLIRPAAQAVCNTLS